MQRPQKQKLASTQRNISMQSLILVSDIDPVATVYTST